MYISFVSRLIFALIFLIASLNKLRNPAAFVQTIQQLGCRLWLAKISAWLVIACEGFLALLFISGFYPALSIITAVTLLFVFAGAAIKAILAKQEIACNCFGESEARLGKGTLIRVFLLIIPVICYFVSSRLSGPIWWPTNLSTAIILGSLVIGIIALAQWLLFALPFFALVESRRQKERRTTAIKQYRIS